MFYKGITKGMELAQETVFQLIKRAHTKMPEDVLNALKGAHASEESKIPKLQLKNILENIEIASKKGVPICQDTGVHTFYLHGPEVDLKQARDSIQSGLEQAVKEIPLRPNEVDPLLRTQKQPYPIIHFIPASQNELHYLPKGAGSENMSISKLLLPTDAIKIPDLIVETVKAAGAKPCPPIILGIGIGGTLDHSAYLAKKSLLNPIKNSAQSFSHRIFIPKIFER